MKTIVVIVLLVVGIQIQICASEDTELILAVKNHDTLGIEKILASGVDVNAKNFLGQTALLCAAREDDFSMFKRLLDAKADVNSQDEFKWTALLWAVFNNNLRMVEMLLKTNVDVNVKDRDHRSALKWAILQKNMKMMLLLLQAGADIPDGLNDFEIATLDRIIIEINEERISQQMFALPYLDYLFGQVLYDSPGNASFPIVQRALNAGPFLTIPLASKVIKEREINKLQKIQKLQAVARGFQARKEMGKKQKRWVK